MNEILISYIGMPEKEAERHTLSDGGFIMIEKKIKLMSSGQILSFCKACQKLESDVDVTDMSNRNYQIDGKSLLGLMSVKLGLPMRVVISGSDEELAEQYLGKYELNDYSIFLSASSIGTFFIFRYSSKATIR